MELEKKPRPVAEASGVSAPPASWIQKRNAFECRETELDHLGAEEADSC